VNKPLSEGRAFNMTLMYWATISCGSNFESVDKFLSVIVQKKGFPRFPSGGLFAGLTIFAQISTCGFNREQGQNIAFSFSKG